MTDNNWQKYFTELNDFVLSSDGININPDSTEIALESKGQFYSLFNQVREAFITSENAGILNKTITLSEKYQATKAYLATNYNISKIIMDDGLSTFLSTPKKELCQPLFDLLFKLLAGSIDINDFRASAIEAIEYSFVNLYSQGYRMWLLLEIIKSVNARKIFSITVPQIPATDIRVGRLLQFKTSPEIPISPPDISDVIDLTTDQVNIVCVPNYILEVKEGTWLSAKIGLPKCLATANMRNQTRKWCSTRQVEHQKHKNSIFLYLGKTPEELSLVSDVNYVCRPEFLIYDHKHNKDRQQALCTYAPRQGPLPVLGTVINSKPLIDPPAAPAIYNDLNDVTYLDFTFDETQIQKLLYSMINTWQKKNGEKTI